MFEQFGARGLLYSSCCGVARGLREALLRLSWRCTTSVSGDNHPQNAPSTRCACTKTVIENVTMIFGGA